MSRSNHQSRLRDLGISSEDFWNGFSSWQEMQSYTGYPGGALKRILDSVDTETTVLDIGAGNGAFAVPLAKAAKQVTAVEPSSGQIGRLMENAAAAGANNITVLQSHWEDVHSDELGRHDVVIAAYCFQMKDIRGALQKMHAAANRSLFLVYFADHDLAEPLRKIKEGLGTGPDYIYLLNVLYEMGLQANLEIITRDYEIPIDLQLDVFGYTHGLSPAQKRRLRDYMESEGKTCSHDGAVWVKRQYRDALMQLEKERKRQ